jgi:hypothetical protein
VVASRLPRNRAIQALLFTPLIWYGAMANLVGWRITRRFGWRGQALFVLIIAMEAAIRDHAAAYFTRWMIVAPGVTPFFAHVMMWVVGVSFGLMTMRIIAGSAGSDRLARTA